jgi:hypothetical protein
MALADAVVTTVTDSPNGDIHSTGDLVDSAVAGAICAVLAVPLAAADLVIQADAIAHDARDGDDA